MEKVLRRRPEGINDVYNYLFTSARNNAIDTVQERGALRPLGYKEYQVSLKELVTAGYLS